MLIIGDKIIDEYKFITPNYVLARRFFITGAFLMVITMPFIHYQLPVTVEISILIALLIVLIAGITQEAHKLTILVDIIVALAAFIFFARYIIILIIENSIWNWFFWINISLEIIFFFALYYSLRTATEAFRKIPKHNL